MPDTERIMILFSRAIRQKVMVIVEVPKGMDVAPKVSELYNDVEGPWIDAYHDPIEEGEHVVLGTSDSDPDMYWDDALDMWRFV